MSDEEPKSPPPEIAERILVLARDAVMHSAILGEHAGSATVAAMSRSVELLQDGIKAIVASAIRATRQECEKSEREEGAVLGSPSDIEYMKRVRAEMERNSLLAKLSASREEAFAWKRAASEADKRAVRNEAECAKAMTERTLAQEEVAGLKADLATVRHDAREMAGAILTAKAEAANGSFAGLLERVMAHLELPDVDLTTYE